MIKDWKLKLRYGRIRTEFSHYTVLADGEVVSSELSQCKTGPAILGMKVWASDAHQAIDMIKVIGKEVGFETRGRVEVYETEPEEEPSPNPHAYGLNFTSFDG